MHAEHTLVAPRLGASIPTVPRLSRRVGFWAIAFAFLSVTALSTAPSALYGLYERHEHFSPITITLVYAVYAAGVTASLLLAGHVSDWYGRKAVLIPALTLAVAAAVLFISWQSLTGLLVARVITGLALGATVATATAYITDLDSDPTRPGAAVTRRAGTVGRIAQVGGLAIGPLASGLLARYAPGGLTLPYVVLLVALVVAMLAVLLAPNGRPVAHPLPRYRPQRLKVPAHLPVAGAWALLVHGGEPSRPPGHQGCQLGSPICSTRTADTPLVFNAPTRSSGLSQNTMFCSGASLPGTA